MDAWTAEELINAQTLPTAYGILFILTLFVLLFREAPSAAGPSAGRLLRLAGIAGLVLAFVIVLSWLNLWVALAILLVASAWWLGERRWLPMLSLALSVPLIGYLGIEVGLGVYLPD
jgi:Flp pilus assembly protein TadB